MASTKSSIANIGEALGLKASEFTFLNPPLIEAPFSTIVDLQGNPRQIRDPEQTLRSALGIERVRLNSSSVVNAENGPNGERVFGVENDDRIRFVGNVTNIWSSNGTYINISAVGDFIEITFFGTGLNLSCAFSDAARDIRASIDGGVEGSNLWFNSGAGGSTILGSRNYNANIILKIASNLSLGLHTIKIRNATATNIGIFGFEILNESSQIKVPQGELFAAGLKLVNPSLQSINYNSGFDGNPILNGRGGRVVEYLTPEGKIGKVIQQTNGSAAYLTSADHSNEEVIRQINFREFGTNRADDFSTLTTVVSDRAFSLDDGTTTLVGNDVRTFSGENLQINTTSGYIILTFVGTGLDILDRFFAVTSETMAVTVDGVSVGTFTNAGAITPYARRKIASGLSYGTHTVRISFSAGSINGDHALTDFIIYGPKKPSLPISAREISEYYLMANYDGSTITGTAITDHLQRPIGTLQKVNTREWFYVGAYTAGGSNDVDNPSGEFIFTSTLNNYYEYTFFGTGIVVQHQGTVTGTYTFEVQIDGALNAAGLARSNVTNAGSGNYTTTSATGNAPIRVEFTGLSLGLHTIRVTLKTAARNMGGGCLHVITPIHFSNSKIGSLSMGPAIQFQKETSLSGFDLGRAKALLNFSEVTGNLLRFSSNIAAVVQITTGQFRVFFEKPMKNSRYVVVSGGNATDDSVTTTQARQGPAIAQLRPDSFTIQTGSDSTATNPWDNIFIAVFGELADEESE